MNWPDGTESALSISYTAESNSREGGLVPGWLLQYLLVNNVGQVASATLIKISFPYHLCKGK